MPVGNRAFWINKNMTSDVFGLDIALCQKGHRVSHFGVTDGGVLVITEPWFPVPPVSPNDPDDHAATSEAATPLDPIAAVVHPMVRKDGGE